MHSDYSRWYTTVNNIFFCILLVNMITICTALKRLHKIIHSYRECIIQGAYNSGNIENSEFEIYSGKMQMLFFS